MSTECKRGVLPADLGFWQNKRVLVTGHTGFKGGWLSLWLHQLGASVKGFALEPETNPSLFNVLDLEELIDSDIGDIRDLESLRRTINSFAPDVIFHLAAQPLVRHSYVAPLETFSINVIGTANVLECVREMASVRAVLCITSDKCYENREWHWAYRESEHLGGHDPYSASKACSELVAQSYRRSYFELADSACTCAIATARAGNVIGGGDWSKDRLLPDIVRHFSDSRTLKIRNPAAIRPWQHVFEALHGYLLLGQRLIEEGAAYAQPWNFGPDERSARPVEWVTRHMAERWGRGAQWIVETGGHPHEACYLKLDSSKARDRLGWCPVWSLEQAIEDLTDWHRAQLAGEPMRSWSLQRLNHYMTALGRSNN